MSTGWERLQTRTPAGDHHSPLLWHCKHRKLEGKNFTLPIRSTVKHLASPFARRQQSLMQPVAALTQRLAVPVTATAHQRHARPTRKQLQGLGSAASQVRAIMCCCV